MSAAGHGGLSPRALSRTHAGKPISRNGAKTFNHFSSCARWRSEQRHKRINEDEYFLRFKSYSLNPNFRKSNMNDLHIRNLQFSMAYCSTR